MDRPIAKQKWPPLKIAVLAAVGVLLVAVVSLAGGDFGKTRLVVDASRLSVAQVRKAEFQEYASINGSVQPLNSVYFDLQEGGIVSKVHAQPGDMVKKGDVIIELANSNAQRELIDAENRLLENLNQLRNSKISLTQSKLLLKDQLLDLEFKIVDAEAKYERYTALMNGPERFLSKEAYEAARDQLKYQKDKRALLQERISTESELEQQQSRQIETSIKSLNRSMQILGELANSLVVRAPVGGQLSALSAEIGQSFQRGQRIGQIDQLDQLKVRGDVDQYYISKVSPGQKAQVELDARSYTLQVAKVYPEVKNGVFQVDLTFMAAAPEGVKRGQTLRIDLSLSESKVTNVVDTGGYTRHTGGRWVYLLSPDGRSARRTTVVLGRQNPQAVEVLKGLESGDRIITSDYAGFNDVDELTFAEAVAAP